MLKSVTKYISYTVEENEAQLSKKIDNMEKRIKKLEGEKK